jgi:4-hydroxy-3-methylbut-2-enyl diphosphate reductase
VLVKTNLFIALGAAALTYATLQLIGSGSSLVPILLSFAAILAIYNFDMLKKCTAVFLTQPSRYYFCRRHRTMLLVLSVAAVLIALACGAILGTVSFLLTCLTLLLALPLRIRLLPFSKKRLKTFPGAKEIFSSLGWGTLAVLIPHFSRVNPVPVPAAAAVTFLLVVLIMFVRSTLFDIRDIQGDRLVGRETLPVLIGKDKTKLLLGGVSVFLALLLLLASLRNWLPPGSCCYLGLVAYMVLYLYLYHKRVLFQGLGHELVVDSQLMLAGLIAFLLN